MSANFSKSDRSARRDRKIEERRSQLQQLASANRAAGKTPGRQKKRPPISPRVKFRIFLILVLLIAAFICTRNVMDKIERTTSVKLTDEGFTHSEQFVNCVALNGIDVSELNGDNIEWKKVKTSGADFVFVRAGYRAADDGSLHIDNNFEKNIKAAAKAGLMTGAYFYSQATTPKEAEEEAYFLLELVKPYEITMPLVIDFEIYPDGRLDKKIQAGELYAASLYHDIVLAFCNIVHTAGYESAVYANYDMLTNYMQADLLDDEATIWLARYQETAGLNADYRFWQCTDQAKVGGIKKPVDHDYWYLEPNKVYKTRGAGKKEDSRISIGNCHVSFQRRVTKIKKGRAIPKLGVTYEGKGLKQGRDYTLSVVRNVNPGTGYIIVRGLGKYKNLMMVPFSIE